MNSFSNRKYLLLPSHIGTFDVISGLCSVKLSYTLLEKNYHNYGIVTNQDICSESSVSGDGETRTLTPLLAPDPKSGVSTFHHTPINPGFIHLKETKETLAKNLQDPQSLRIRNPFNNLVDGQWEERDSNPRTLMGADCGM